MDGGDHWNRADLPDYGAAASIQCAGPSSLWALFEGRGVASGHSPYTFVHTVDGISWIPVLYEAYTAVSGPPVLGGARAVDGPGTEPGPFSAISPGAAAFLGHTPSILSHPVSIDIIGRGNTVSPGASVPVTTGADGASFVSPTTAGSPGCPIELRRPT